VARPAAILFDLWGTLIPGIPPTVRDALAFDMAADLGVDPAAFAAAFADSYRERFTGVLGSLEQTVVALAARCGGAPPADAVGSAVARRMALTRGALESDPAALAVLDELRNRGIPMGLVTDTSSETPLLWPESPLAARISATAFSCELGVRKPDPAIYLDCVRALGVPAAACMYVGDGGGGELTGAASLGMDALRLRVSGDHPSDRYDDDAAFSGPEIATLSDLLRLPRLRLD
jgi:putative hydrolase of the HAD superfamily